MGQHDGFSFGANRRFNFRGINIVGDGIHIYKNRNSAKLNNWIYGCRKSCSYPNDFITLLNGTIA